MDNSESVGSGNVYSRINDCVKSQVLKENPRSRNFTKIPRKRTNASGLPSKNWPK
jgi:hypothetical protein